MRRRGQASIIGSILFFVLFAAAMAGVASYSSSQSQANGAANRAQTLMAQRGSEQLTYGALPSGALTIQNTGSSATSLVEVIIKYANGTVYTAAPSTSSLAANNLLQVGQLVPSTGAGSMTLQARYNAILSSTNSADQIGLVTSRGNTFWLKPAVAAQTNPNLTYGVTFDASGTGSFGTTPVVTVDGVGYTTSQLPVTLSWFAGTKHTYSFTTSLPLGTGSRIGVGSVQGISTSASGTMTATATGTIRSSYGTQYQLTVSGGNTIAFIGSPTNDGWYNSGSTGQFTSNYVWNVASGARSNLLSYSLDGSSPASITRSGTGSYTSIGVTMAAPHTIALTPTTQYQLTVSGGNGLTYSLASQTNDGWYDSGSSLTASSNYVWSQVAGQSRQNILSYVLDGTTTNAARSNSGTFATPTITMNAAHALTFNPVAQYYLTVSGGISTAVAGSQTGDGWFDSGSSAQAQSGYSWNTVAGQSRSNLYSYTVDSSPATTIAQAGSGTYTTPSIAMNTYHTVTFNPVTQYFLSVNGGSGLVYVNSQTSDGWYNAGTTIASVTTNYDWSVVSGQSRQNLIFWNIDGGTNTVVARSGSGAYTTSSFTMNTYHTLNLNGQTQYALNSVGGNGVTFGGSQTGDGWYDSGTTATAATNYVWSIVAGQSRLNLVSWNLDGGANQAVTRAGSGTFTTTSVTMNTFHTLNFNSVIQYYVTFQNSVPSSGGTGALAISYSYTALNTGSWSCTQFSLSSLSGTYTGGTASQALCPQPPSSWYVTQVSWNIAVTQSGTPGDTLSFYVSGGGYNSGWYACSSGCSGSLTYNFGTSANIVLQWRESPGCWSSRILDYVNCGTTFAITSAGGYQGTAPASGSTTSSPNSFSVSGSTVTYSYGIGYNFPSGSSSTSWSASWPSAESYSSSTCAGASISGSTISSSTGGACILSTTYSGSYSSSGTSPTGDGWYDAGSSAPISASTSGPFAFSSWSTSSAGLLPITSSGSASTSMTVNTYGTVTANFSVNQ